MTNTTSASAAGYIVHDNENCIHGIGATSDEAWVDMLHTMDQDGTTVLSQDDDSTEQLGNWTRESNLKIQAASARLLQTIKDDGGNLKWRVIGGLAVTDDEI